MKLQSRALHGLFMALASLLVLVGSALPGAANLATGTTIYGQVLTSGGQPLAGATLSFSEGLATQTTDSDGRYEVLAPNGRYLVVPRKDGFAFQPSYATAVISDSDAEANFTGTVVAVAQPTFSPAPGAFLRTVTVGIACATEGATLRYTLDGTEVLPTSPRYEAPLTFTRTTYIKARGYKEGLVPGRMAMGVYRIEVPATVAAPRLAPAPGTYSSAVNVTITSETAGATIRYTLDGTEVTSASPVYTNPIAISTTKTLKARAYKEGMTPSVMVGGPYTINSTQRVATPVFSPASGTYATATVTITCATAGATIRLTYDGSEPTAAPNATRKLNSRPDGSASV